MRALLNCFTTVVSLYFDDDDDDCVFANNDFTVRGWTIGELKLGYGLGTAAPAGDLWPHQVISWEYWSGGILGIQEYRSDPQLTVIGNINCNILCLDIDISILEGAPPGYPENLIVKDQTGDRANLAGVYRRQGDSRVWKYGDYELSFNGEY